MVGTKLEVETKLEVIIELEVRPKLKVGNKLEVGTKLKVWTWFPSVFCMRLQRRDGGKKERRKNMWENNGISSCYA